jgi:hypothetical protein
MVEDEKKDDGATAGAAGLSDSSAVIHSAVLWGFRDPFQCWLEDGLMVRMKNGRVIWEDLPCMVAEGVKDIWVCFFFNEK